MRVGWEAGNPELSSKAHLEPTITTCSTQARAQGKSSGVCSGESVLNVSDATAQRGPWFGGRRSQSPEPNLASPWPEVTHDPKAR